MGPYLFEIFLDNGFYNPNNNWNGFHHNHGSFEIQFILQGTCMIYANHSYLKLRERQFCIIPPLLYHSQIRFPDHSVQKICFKFNFKKLSKSHDEEQDLEADGLRNIADHLTLYSSEYSGKTIALIEEIKQELIEKPMGYRLRIQHLFACILIDILRKSPQQPVSVTPHFAHHLDSQRMNIIDTFFGIHFAEPARENDLADLLKVSNRHLNRILHELYGASFRQKLLETRLRVSMELLVNSALSVKQISENAGFPSPEYYTSVFKTKMGMTPISFRNKFLQNEQHYMQNKEGVMN
jgi:AraC-like DNA-binding protein